MPKKIDMEKLKAVSEKVLCVTTVPDMDKRTQRRLNVFLGKDVTYSALSEMFSRFPRM